jgi:hypothetical protein
MSRGHYVTYLQHHGDGRVERMMTKLDREAPPRNWPDDLPIIRVERALKAPAGRWWVDSEGRVRSRTLVRFHAPASIQVGEEGVVSAHEVETGEEIHVLFTVGEYEAVTPEVYVWDNPTKLTFRISPSEVRYRSDGDLTVRVEDTE